MQFTRRCKITCTNFEKSLPQTSVNSKPVLAANQRFVGSKAINFWQYVKHSFRKIDKLVEIRLLIRTLKNWMGTKLRAHQIVFTALSTIDLRKFGHSLVSQKVGENTAQNIKWSKRY